MNDPVVGEIEPEVRWIGSTTEWRGEDKPGPEGAGAILWSVVACGMATAFVIGLLVG